MSGFRKALQLVGVTVCLVVVGACAANDAAYVGDTTQDAANDTQIAGGEIGDTEQGAPLAEIGSNVSTPEIAAHTEELAAAADKQIGIELEQAGGYTAVKLQTAVPSPKVEVTRLSNPQRLVLDILGESVKGSQNYSVENDNYLKSIRVGSHKNRARIVFDLADNVSGTGKIEHHVDSTGGNLVVSFNGEGGAETAVASPVASAEEVTQPPIETASTDSITATDAPVRIESLSFLKGENSAGQVTIQLSDEAAFELKQTAPSEYALRIPGATASDISKEPQIAPQGTPGIRSARVVQEGGAAMVRMFVDAQVNLTATPKGSQIVVKALPIKSDLYAARAQLAEPAKAGEAEAGKEAVAANQEAVVIQAADGTKTYTGRLISLDLQDTDIDNALRIIAEVSNLNIIASEDVAGKVTLRLIDVPWDQALDVILKTNGLDQVKEGNVIRIAPVEKLRAEREALKAAQDARKQLEELQVRYIRVSYARVTDIKEQVESVLSERGSVSVDERTNQIVVKDIGEGQDKVAELVKKLDLRTPQVLLETQIVEASRALLRDLGFQWNFKYARAPQYGNQTGWNFPSSMVLTGSGEGGNFVDFPAGEGSAAISAVLDSADGARALTARLSALETEGKVKVISRPQVATVNNEKAEISSVETVRVRLPSSGTSVATGAGATASGGGSTAFQEIEVGIHLTVTPQASPDYYVLMDIDAKSSTFSGRTVDNIPNTIDRKATSTILVKSGQTFALGGVYRIEDRDTVEGLPFFKDIPVIGTVFRRSAIDKQHQELIFFITPHIVEGSFDPSLM